MAAQTPAADVLRAVQLAMAPDTPNEARAEASAYLERVKGGGTGEVVALAGVLLQADAGAQAPLVHNFALHLLEHVVTTRWNGMGEPERAFFKERAAALLGTGAVAASAPAHLRGKVAKVVVEVAERAWPQQWPALTPALLEGARQRPGALLVALLVWRDLAEGVLAFNPNLPQQRRNDVLRGLEEALPAVLSLACAVLQGGGAGVPPAVRLPVVTAALELLGALFQFVPAAAVLEGGALAAVWPYVGSADTFRRASDVLDAAAARKTASVEERHHEVLLRLWDVHLGSAQSLLRAGPEQYAYVERACRSVRVLLSHHARLAARHPATLQRVLETVGGLFAHPDLEVSDMAAGMWSDVARNHSAQMLRPEFRAQLAGQITQVALARMVKPADADPLPRGQEADENGERTAFRQRWGVYRGHVLGLVSALALEEPEAVLAAVAAHLEVVLAEQRSPEARQLMAQRPLTWDSPLLRRMEGAGVVLEAALRNLTDRAHARAAAVETRALQLLLAERSPDPVLLGRQLAACAWFGGLYRANAQVLQFVVAWLLESVRFRRADEPASLPWERLGEDTRSARRRACYSLVTIARNAPEALVASFAEVSRRVLEMVAQADVGEAERLLLHEVLVTVASSMPDRGQQTGYIARVLSAPVTAWQSERVAALMASPQALVAALMAGEGEPLAELRREARDHLNSFVSIYRRVVLRDLDTGEPHPAGVALLRAVLPNVLRLTTQIHSLFAPEAAARLGAPGLAAVMRLDLIDRKLIMGEGALTAEEKATPLYRRQWWVTSVRELCAQLAGHATSLGAAFYAEVPAQAVAGSMLHNLAHVSYRHCKYVVDRFLVPWVDNCPEAVLARDPSFRAALGGALSVLPQRLAAAWAARGAQAAAGASAGGSQRDDILDECGLHELGCSFFEFVSRAAHIPDGPAAQAVQQGAGGAVGAGGAGGARSPAAVAAASAAEVRAPVTPLQSFGIRKTSEARRQTMLAYLMRGGADLAAPLLAAVAAGIMWPDRPTKERACHVGYRLVPLVVDQPQYHDAVAQIMMACLRELASLAAGSKTDKLFGQLSSLVKECYTRVGAASAVPRNVLLSVPGVEQQHVANLDAALASAGRHDSRKWRRCFRDFLTYFVLGKASAFQSSKAIQDLPQQLAARGFRAAQGAAAPEERDLAPQLFGDLFATAE